MLVISAEFDQGEHRSHLRPTIPGPLIVLPPPQTALAMGSYHTLNFTEVSAGVRDLCVPVFPAPVFPAPVFPRHAVFPAGQGAGVRDLCAPVFPAPVFPAPVFLRVAVLPTVLLFFDE